MVKKCIVGFLFFLSVGYSYAQTSTCAQTLRLARSTYEQGRFHEIPALLENCLASGDSKFTKQERVEALRILTLAYLYQEEPELADATMIRLLNTDHFYEVNRNVDPAEFTALYATFRTNPVFALGLKFLLNTTYPTALNNYYVASGSPGKGEYSPLFNFQVGASFEKQLFHGKPNSKLSRLTAAPELMFVKHSFGYANEELTTSDQTGESFSRIDGKITQTRIDLNGLIQYKLKESTINPYAMIGPGVSYLVRTDSDLETQFPSRGSVVTGTSVDMSNTFNAFDFTANIGAGLKFKFGEIYLTADVRYKYGLTSLINKSTRSNLEATFDYGFGNNDIRQSSVIVNIGFTWPYFNPKKLVK